MLDNLGWVAPEGSDVCLDPLECQVLVPEAQVSRHDVITGRQKAQNSESVVQSHQNLSKIVTLS